MQIRKGPLPGVQLEEATLRDRRAELDTTAYFSTALATPTTIDKVEAVEVMAKQLWSDVLLGENASIDDVRAAISFFHRIGFLFKYKSYGVKVASPFGYSLFDLKEHAGFSFHRHSPHKSEAFHVLRPSPSGFVYLSTLEEWTTDGRLAVESWVDRGDALPNCRYVYKPGAGDVIEIGLGNVHTIIGCVVEEFASSSEDLVHRMLDQNLGRSIVPPQEHPDVSLLLHDLDLRPRLRVYRELGSWRSAPMEAEENVVAVPELTGNHLSFSGGKTRYDSETEVDQITVLVVLAGSIDVHAVGQHWGVSSGQLLAIPPAISFSLRSYSDAFIAMHKVSTGSAIKHRTEPSSGGAARRAR